MENNFELILKATGVVTSPNHPGYYPHNMDKTETIEVESGKILRLEFTHFAVHTCDDVTTCSCDFVKITDGDGTTLMDNSCGYSSVDPSHPYYFLPPIITTRSNRVEIFFHTNHQGTDSGWSLSWSAVTPGEKALMLNSIKISHHSPSIKTLISSLHYRPQIWLMLIMRIWVCCSFLQFHIDLLSIHLSTVFHKLESEHNTLPS